MKIKTVVHNAESIGTILDTNMPTKELQLTCKICKARTAERMLDNLCNPCFRRITFTHLPDDEKERLICSIIPVRYASARIEDLNPMLAGKLINAVDGVYLWGRPGAGKTYACAAVGRDFLSKGFLVQRIGYEMLMLKLRDTFKSQSRYGELDVIQPYIDADKLIIEDVGTTVSAGSQESDFSLRTLLVLLNERIEKQLPTYITGNKPLSELGKSFDARIESRLSLFENLQIKGDDRRKKNVRPEIQSAAI